MLTSRELTFSHCYQNFQAITKFIFWILTCPFIICYFCSGIIWYMIFLHLKKKIMLKHVQHNFEGWIRKRLLLFLRHILILLPKVLCQRWMDYYQYVEATQDPGATVFLLGINVYLQHPSIARLLDNLFCNILKQAYPHMLELFI